MATKPYIDDAIRTHVDQQAKGLEIAERKRLTWLRTAHGWRAFVVGLGAEITEDVDSLNTEMAGIHGDAWVPLTVTMKATQVLLITTPVVVRQVWFDEKTHRFTIKDVNAPGKYPEISRRDGDYYVEKPTDDAVGFDVYFQNFKSSSKVEDAAQEIIKPLLRPLLS
jgi:hypothetical protein